ncbi:MAG: type I 3-dehydroquinate dehydratase [Verrucomicrobiota bacterium]
MPPPSTIVGTIHTLRGLHQALRLKPGEVDLLEIRVDAFADAPAPILTSLSKLKSPLLITVRHPLEGAIQPLSPARRRELFYRFLPYATLIDLELRSAKQFFPLIEEAHTNGIGVILSHHDFTRTPSRKRLQDLAGSVRQLGGDIFKVAATTHDPGDLVTLLGFLSEEKSIPLSIMGMGRLGKVSRLLFAQAGSLLNYGFLDKAQVNGQWSAPLLKTRLSELQG